MIFTVVSDLNAQTAPILNSLFVVAHVVSIGAPAWSEYLLNVQPTETGVELRYFRFAPAAEFCPRTITIRGAKKESRVKLDQILQPRSPCSISENDFQQSVARASSKARSTTGAVAYTIVANCSAGQKTFKVPYVETVDLKRLRSQSAAVAEVVELYSSLEARFFHGDQISRIKHPKDQQLQLNAQAFVEALKSGRFDVGFESGRLQEILEMYKGPLSAVEPEPKLLDFEKWKLTSYVDPSYPTVEKPPKVETKVELEVSVDPTSGHVKSLRILRGNPLFNASTTDAAVQWSFDPAQSVFNPLKLTVDYSLGCRVIAAKP